MPTLSVAICTYNRAKSLSVTLDSLMRQAGSITDWELLVVDNNSSDGTSDVVSSLAGSMPIRCVREHRQGLSHARNRALQECKGQIIIFTDDDVRLESRWLNGYLDATTRFSQVEYFGGRIKPDWRGGRPGWLREESMALLDGLLVHYDLGVETRVYTAGDPLPFGASFAVRRSLFERMAPFRTDLGVIGNVPGRSEETEYLGRARKAQAQGVYVGTALCWHAVHRQRLKLLYLFEYGRQKGIAHSLLGGEAFSEGSYRKAGVYLIKGAHQLLKGRGDRFRQCVINAGIQFGLKAETKPQSL